MRGFIALLIPLLVAGCSNPAPPADDTGRDASASTTAPSVPTTKAAPQAATVDAIAIDPLYGAVANGSETPAAMLNRYMLDLLNRNTSRSDAAWAYAPADPRRADDAVLRLLPDVRNLRLDSDVALPRDDGQPPRLLEVPVKIRALTANGTFRYHGWYRVQPSANGRSWQIQSASLQPTLD
ncbi:hypothetical protein KZX71_12140 [Stenotrophomonas indicatrix]|nr:hypothetical protein [Stenotrophomonas indicatrix]MCK6231731.1 hypothetical protein [Stenotrophomonas indicatrix]